jgi:hypothetical protein
MFDTLFAAIGRSDTRRQLNALSDHQLRDIGLSRDQIDDVAQAMQAVRPQPAARRGLAARGLSLAPLFRAFRSA